MNSPMSKPNRPSLAPHRARAALPVLAASLLLAGCSSLGQLASGDSVDYRSSGARPAPLEVPPDLTQLAADTRFQPQGGSVTASAFQAAVADPKAPTAARTVAAQSAGDVRIERAGDQRWLHASLPPEQLWPKVQSFWRDRGFTLTGEQPQAGIIETEWAENRAKLPNDALRRTLGKVLDFAYSTGELDKFRTRIERAADGGSDIYITHRGMAEVYTNQLQDRTVWQPRPSDPLLESEFLSRLMIELGAPEDKAREQVAQSLTPHPARAHVVEGQAAATLQLDEGFDRAWRRVGLALDRGGFTVEDRDRAQGVYFVRYVDPAAAGREQPGFFGRLFGKKSDTTELERYRVVVKGDANGSTASVHDAQGEPDKGKAAQRIVALLLEDLK